jgi:membrane protease YdiL (CAAX protease family)
VLEGYWKESSRPLVSLAFVVPMLLAYEGGLLLIGPQAMRNGADVWLRQFLDWLGFGQYFLLPILTCGILLGWHHVKRERWQVGWSVLYGMLLESVALGLLLVALACLQGALLVPMQPEIPCALEAGEAMWGRVVAYFGAGIYEELLFRLMLLPVVAMLLRLGGLKTGTSLFLSVVITSLFFAAAHYRIDLLIGPYHVATHPGDTFAWASFFFRVLAGSFFCVLFLYRGFGIAAGTHALYDILVSVL